MELRIWSRNYPDTHSHFLYCPEDGLPSLTQQALEFVREAVAQQLAEAGNQPIATWNNTNVEMMEPGDKKAQGIWGVER